MEWLRGYFVGSRVEPWGVDVGNENTNYFVTATKGRYVLTLIERLTAVTPPIYLTLVPHLSQQGVPCPKPVANPRRDTLGALNRKSATIVTPARYQTLVTAFRKLQIFEPVQHRAWPLMTRAAALRCRMSRLLDFFLPGNGELTHELGPAPFRRFLELHRKLGVELSCG